MDTRRAAAAAVVRPSVVAVNTERRLQSRNDNKSADTDVSKAEGLTTGEESCNVSTFCVTLGLLSWAVLGCYSVIVAGPPASPTSPATSTSSI